MSAAGHPTPPGPSSPPPTSTPPRVQRSGISASPANGFATVTGARVQRSSTPAATPGSAAGPDSGVLDPATTSRIQRASGRGASLDSSLRPGLESALGADLGNVNIHADSPLRHRPSDQHPHAPGRGHRLLGEVALPGQGSQEAARRTRAVEAGGDDRTPGDESAPSRVCRLRCRERRRRDEGQQVRQEDGGLGVVDPRQDQPHHRCRCAQPRRRRPTRTRRQDPGRPQHCRLRRLHGSTGAGHITDDPLSVRFRSSLELPDRVASTALLDRLVTRHLDIVDEYAGIFS
jgi:hypothetical protein